MGLSVQHLVLLLVVVLLLFGRGKLSELMGDVGKGIRSFRKGMTEDDVPASRSTIDADAAVKDVPRTC